jgi:hypothetical protein
MSVPMTRRGPDAIAPIDEPTGWRRGAWGLRPIPLAGILSRLASPPSSEPAPRSILMADSGPFTARRLRRSVTGGGSHVGS